MAMNMVLKAVSQNSFIQRGHVHRADLNGDGWQDFYMVLWAGDHSNWNGHQTVMCMHGLMTAMVILF